MEEKFMQEALLQAKIAFDLDEVPIGAVIVFENRIIARAHNQRVTGKNSLFHAEILAIHEACKFFDDWRLDNCSMFVTVEPCAMCSGAIIQARIRNLYFSAFNKKAGFAGSLCNVFETEGLNHKVNVHSALLENESAQLMSDFFARLRKNKTELPQNLS